MSISAGQSFACKCGCGFDTVDTQLLKLLTRIREHFDVPVRVTSGCRCPAYNKAVGGAEHSYHMQAKAADIVVDGIPPDLVQELAYNLGAGGLGKYKTFTHVDVRDAVAVWAG